ncbi:MAG: hypothetical protein ACRCXK_04960 [Wohlfahrtiimonas sp.]
MDSNSILFMLMTVLAIATLCLCTAILICNYKRRNELSYEKKIWQNSLIGGLIAFVILTYPIFYWGKNFKEVIDLLLRLIPIIMGAIAFAIAFLNFQRKSGYAFKAYITGITTHSSGNQKISRLILINEKDRAVSISAIFLKIGNYRVSLKEFMKDYADSSDDPVKIFSPYHSEEISLPETNRDDFLFIEEADTPSIYVNNLSSLKLKDIFLDHANNGRFTIKNTDLFSIEIMTLDSVIECKVQQINYQWDDKKTLVDYLFKKDISPNIDNKIFKEVTLSIQDKKVVETEILKR